MAELDKSKSTKESAKFLILKMFYLLVSKLKALTQVETEVKNQRGPYKSKLDLCGPFANA